MQVSEILLPTPSGVEYNDDGTVSVAYWYTGVDSISGRDRGLMFIDGSVYTDGVYSAYWDLTQLGNLGRAALSIEAWLKEQFPAQDPDQGQGVAAA